MFVCAAVQQAASIINQLVGLLVSYTLRLEKRQRAVVGTAISCCQVKFCGRTNERKPMQCVEVTNILIPAPFAGVCLAAAVQGV
jgi:hypothetical protein